MQKMRLQRLALAGALLALALVANSGPALAQQSGNALALVAGNTDFALRLYQEIRTTEKGNFLFSPYSISQALAMTYAGARGETEKQMASALSFSLRQDELHRTFLLLNGELVAKNNAKADEKTRTLERTLRIVSALWGEKTIPFDAAFMAMLQANYGAGLRPVDFINRPDAARQQINQWAADETNGRIKDLVPPPAITPLTRLVLANAVYFKASWATPFPEKATEDARFTLLDGSQVRVPMMTKQETVPYLRGEGYQAVVLPFAGGAASFLIILPDSGRFEAIEKGLDFKFVKQLAESLNQRREVRLTVPRFRFESSFSLPAALKKLGLIDAFDSDKADFSAMGKMPSGQRLYITDVLHKSFIAADENGTEAAAATAVIIGVTSAPLDQPVEVRVDRPFLFAIQDAGTGSLLFVGRVLNPAQ